MSGTWTAESIGYLRKARKAIEDAEDRLSEIDTLRWGTEEELVIFRFTSQAHKLAVAMDDLLIQLDAEAD